jgi:hypothetical protein
VERRECTRYPVSVEIEITELGSRIPSRGQTTDLSLSGCYVATIFHLPIGALVDFKMWVDDDNIKGHGSVQTCHGGVGMGIKFTDLTRDVMNRLDDYLQAATSETPEKVAQLYIR